MEESVVKDNPKRFGLPTEKTEFSYTVHEKVNNNHLGKHIQGFLERVTWKLTIPYVK